MDVAIAVAHILSAVVVQSVLSTLWLLAAYSMNSREGDALQQALSIDLGVTSGELFSEDMLEPATRWIAARYSSELLRNRLSDFCGIIRILWDWAGITAMVALFVYVVWQTITAGLAYAKAAWLVIPLWLVFSLASMAFAVTCKILTGRYPGQARSARKMLAKAVRAMP